VVTEKKLARKFLNPTPYHYHSLISCFVFQQFYKYSSTCSRVLSVSQMLSLPFLPASYCNLVSSSRVQSLQATIVMLAYWTVYMTLFWTIPHMHLSEDARPHLCRFAAQDPGQCRNGSALCPTRKAETRFPRCHGAVTNLGLPRKLLNSDGGELRVKLYN